jgi:hypothetical protein
VTVTRIDRLARSTFDLFAIVKRIVDTGAQFRSLAEPWSDTATSTGRLMIAVLGGLADVERDLIRTRTAEGRKPCQRTGTAHGPSPCAHSTAARRSSEASGCRRYAEGVGAKLQLGQGHDLEARGITRGSQPVSAKQITPAQLAVATLVAGLTSQASVPACDRVGRRNSLLVSIGRATLNRWAICSGVARAKSNGDRDSPLLSVAGKGGFYFFAIVRVVRQRHGIPLIWIACHRVPAFHASRP